MSSSSVAFPPPSLAPLVSEVSSLLKDKSQTVSFAETCCGGLMSSSILSAPGASKIYKGGLTLYTLESRISYAGWTQANIQAYKGPSPEVVSSMARNVRKELGTDYVLAESGTAGPAANPSATLARNRTPGFVAFAVDSDKGCFTKVVETGSDDRAGNMVAFAEEGFKFLKEVIAGEAKL